MFGLKGSVKDQLSKFSSKESKSSTSSTSPSKVTSKQQQARELAAAAKSKVEEKLHLKKKTSTSKHKETSVGGTSIMDTSQTSELSPNGDELPLAEINFECKLERHEQKASTVLEAAELLLDGGQPEQIKKEHERKKSSEKRKSSKQSSIEKRSPDKQIVHSHDQELSIPETMSEKKPATNILAAGDLKKPTTPSTAPQAKDQKAAPVTNILAAGDLKAASQPQSKEAPKASEKKEAEPAAKAKQPAQAADTKAKAPVTNILAAGDAKAAAKKETTKETEKRQETHILAAGDLKETSKADAKPHATDTKPAAASAPAAPTNILAAQDLKKVQTPAEKSAPESQTKQTEPTPPTNILAAADLKRELDALKSELIHPETTLKHEESTNLEGPAPKTPAAKILAATDKKDAPKEAEKRQETHILAAGDLTKEAESPRVEPEPKKEPTKAPVTNILAAGDLKQTKTQSAANEQVAAPSDPATEPAPASAPVTNILAAGGLKKPVKKVEPNSEEEEEEEDDDAPVVIRTGGALKLIAKQQPQTEKPVIMQPDVELKAHKIEETTTTDTTTTKTTATAESSKSAAETAANAVMDQATADAIEQLGGHVALEQYQQSDRQAAPAPAPASPPATGPATAPATAPAPAPAPVPVTNILAAADLKHELQQQSKSFTQMTESPLQHDEHQEQKHEKQPKQQPAHPETKLAHDQHNQLRADDEKPAKQQMAQDTAPAQASPKSPVAPPVQQKPVKKQLVLHEAPGSPTQGAPSPKSPKPMSPLAKTPEMCTQPHQAQPKPTQPIAETKIVNQQDVQSNRLVQAQEWNPENNPKVNQQKWTGPAPAKMEGAEWPPRDDSNAPQRHGYRPQRLKMARADAWITEPSVNSTQPFPRAAWNKQGKAPLRPAWISDAPADTPAAPQMNVVTVADKVPPKKYGPREKTDFGDDNELSDIIGQEECPRQLIVDTSTTEIQPQQLPLRPVTPTPLSPNQESFQQMHPGERTQQQPAVNNQPMSNKAAQVSPSQPKYIPSWRQRGQDGGSTVPVPGNSQPNVIQNQAQQQALHFGPGQQSAGFLGPVQVQVPQQLSPNQHQSQMNEQFYQQQVSPSPYSPQTGGQSDYHPVQAPKSPLAYVHEQPRQDFQWPPPGSVDPNPVPQYPVGLAGSKSPGRSPLPSQPQLGFSPVAQFGIQVTPGQKSPRLQTSPREIVARHDNGLDFQAPQPYSPNHGQQQFHHVNALAEESPFTRPQQEESPFMRPQQEESPFMRPQQEESPFMRPQQEESPFIRPQQEESPFMRPQQEESPFIRPQQEESPFIRPQQEESPFIRPQQEESPFIRPQQEESPFMRPQQEESPFMRPQQEESPFMRPQQEESPFMRPQQEESPFIRPQQEESPFIRPQQEESPFTRPQQEESPFMRPQQEESPIKRPQQEEFPIKRPQQEQHQHYMEQEQRGFQNVAEHHPEQTLTFEHQQHLQRIDDDQNREYAFRQQQAQEEYDIQQHNIKQQKLYEQQQEQQRAQMEYEEMGYIDPQHATNYRQLPQHDDAAPAPGFMRKTNFSEWPPRFPPEYYD